MKIIVLFFVLFLSACSGPTSLIERRFPPISPNLARQCEDLELVTDTEKLSEVLKVVTNNYGKYHECSIRTEEWQMWYREQKLIFEQLQ